MKRQPLPIKITLLREHIEKLNEEAATTQGRSYTLPRHAPPRTIPELAVTARRSQGGAGGKRGMLVTLPR